MNIQELTTVSDSTLINLMSEQPHLQQYASDAKAHAEILRQVEITWANFTTTANTNEFQTWKDAWMAFCEYSKNEAVELLRKKLINTTDETQRFGSEPFGRNYTLYICEYGAIRIYDNGTVTRKTASFGPASIFLAAITLGGKIHYLDFDLVNNDFVLAVTEF